MSNGEYANGQKPKTNISRGRMSLHKKLRVKNRRLVEIIKHERLERAALEEKIRLQEEVSSRLNLEVAMLKTQLMTVKSALQQTDSLMEDGFNSLRVAKIRLQELQDGINEESVNPEAIDKGPEQVANSQPASSSHNSNLGLVPPPKLQARVNPMVQGVPLMSPSIMLQRLQPDDLERQMSTTPRAATATTPISPTMHEATVPNLSEEGQTRQLDGSQAPGGSFGVQRSSFLWYVNSGAQQNLADASTLRRSSRLRRQ